MKTLLIVLFLFFGTLPVVADYSYSFYDPEYHHSVIVTSLTNGKVFAKLDGKLLVPKYPCKKSINFFKDEVHLVISGSGQNLFLDRNIPAKPLNAIWIDTDMKTQNEGEKFRRIIGNFKIGVSTNKHDLKMIIATFKVRKPQI